ncbi:MAG: SusC/RagA family TonB-linked outer membrane protein [Muribaculaceae bacterium]|nr:SusC/RagA family TonB-linked outer membrane protein [Muribaculaceae bacterium]
MKQLTNFLKAKRALTSAFLATLLWTSAAAQNLTVTGTVTDPIGEVLIGVSVSVKGDQTKGTATDFDGNYTLKEVPSNATLVFSYVGFQSKEIAVNGRTVVDATLSEDHELLDEVVVIGYGTLSKKEVSSSIVQVNSDDFMKGAVNSPMEMLTGKVAGLNVSSTASADPNGGADLQVRGATSISAGNGPLIVVDGVPGADIKTIAPQDIESMSVLKDASSAAIYGTRGANGVILITTKKGSGEVGKPLVTYDSYAAIGFAKGKPQVLSPEEWRAARRGHDFRSNTNWYDLITRDVNYDTNQYVGIEGALNGGGYYTASISYKNANGLDIKSKREEFGGRAAVSANTLDNHLKFTFTLNARKSNEDYKVGNYFGRALTLNPTMPVYNPDGTWYRPNDVTNPTNPVNQMTTPTSKGVQDYILGTADLRYNIWSNEYNTLSTTLSYSYTYHDFKKSTYYPSESDTSINGGFNGEADLSYEKWWTNRLEWLGNYTFQNEDNNLGVVVAYSYERSDYNSMSESNYDFTFNSPLWNNIGAGSWLAEGRANMGSYASQNTLIGFLGRVNYSWKNMIIASASVRHEGSSKFGSDRKWGTFPAASVAWEMAQAPFLRDYVQVVQSLKPRFSYGQTGRSDFNPYQALPTYSSVGEYPMNGVNNQWDQGYRPSNNANALLGWEKLISYNVGVDFMLWNRVYGSIEYFDRESKDLLYRYTAPQPPFIYDNILVNVGTIRNEGVELALNGDIIVNKPVTWTMGINYSYSTTKLTKLSNDVYQAAYLDLYSTGGIGSTSYLFRVEEGGKVGQFYGFKTAGVDPENHTMLVYNKDNEIIPVSAANQDDKRYIGNGAPQHFLTWSNSLKYKGWDLNLMFTGAFGFDIYNNMRVGMGLQQGGSVNVLRSAYGKDQDLWYNPGDVTSYFLEKGDYFKLENITLGYTFPLKNRKILDSLRIYLSAKNVFTLTKYKGTDPSAVPSTGLTPGVDNSDAYPQATQLTLGVTVRFR